jgi:hypothetical protein
VSDGQRRVPFRWDLIRPDQLGSLLDGTPAPDLWFLDSLVECAGKVVARCGGGDLVFVGRSLDSMFDLLSGALSGTDAPVRLSRLPLSFARPFWGPLTIAERAQARRILAGMGLAPGALARRDVPVAFADVVSQGSTFGDLFAQVRQWVDDEHAQWDVIRSKVRFIGVTPRKKTSPSTFRWQQHAAWTRELPAASVVNVSLDQFAWSHFADYQVKLHRSFRPKHWVAEADPPGRDEKTRQALAEAVALVAYGRSPQGRRALARAMGREPALSKAWVRSLVTHLSSGS